MDIAVRLNQGIPVADVGGEIDLSNITDLADALANALKTSTIGRGSGLVVDLTRVTYLNSATIKLLFDLSENMRTRELNLCVVLAAEAPTRKLLLLVKFDQIAPLFPTVDEAIKRIQASVQARERRGP
jgi:anti-anti-sigma factor